jgi:hypothetical protein
VAGGQCDYEGDIFLQGLENSFGVLCVFDLFFEKGELKELLTVSFFSLFF